MAQPTNILLIEDNSDDAELIAHELEKSGLVFRITRIMSASELQKLLKEKQWDIIISDYNLPGFDGISALKILKKSGLDIPFLFVSGTVGEEFAVESVLAGANDYVMKDNLKRIPVAVRRELRASVLRAQKKIADEQVLASLKEKEVLLKEIHHRVKNNLAVISALLTLQADYAKDDDSRQLLQDSVNRIKSMALIHEKLYQSEMLATVPMGEYLRELVSTIKDSYNPDESMIIIHVAAANIHLDVTRAIPIGLIINELLSNAYKHAFKGKETGNVHLSMKMNEADDKCMIEVKDDGVGLPEEVINGEASSLGYTIVRGLCSQLGGTLDMCSSDGTCVCIEIDMPKN